MSKLFSLCLFHTSFIPLWATILFMDITSTITDPTHQRMACIRILFIFTSCSISTLVLFVKLCTKKVEGTTPRKVISATEEKSIISEYLLSYILPWLAFDFSQCNQMGLFLFFYFTLGFLCVRHNHFSVNIVVEILNFRLYTCVIENEDAQQSTQKILSRHRLNGCIGDTLYLKPLNNEYKLDVRNKKVMWDR